jgi:DNA-directed RNA polymerase subunit RPC12/RpoP
MTGHTTKLMEDGGPDGSIEVAEYKCLDCGCDMLEEIMTAATVTSYITNIWDNGEIEYADFSTGGGGVDRYQCMNCGKTVLDEFCLKITESGKLYKWLKEHNAKGG